MAEGTQKARIILLITGMCLVFGLGYSWYAGRQLQEDLRARALDQGAISADAINPALYNTILFLPGSGRDPGLARLEAHMARLLDAFSGNPGLGNHVQSIYILVLDGNTVRLGPSAKDKESGMEASFGTVLPADPDILTAFHADSPRIVTPRSHGPGAVYTLATPLPRDPEANRFYLWCMDIDADYVQRLMILKAAPPLGATLFLTTFLLGAGAYVRRSAKPRNVWRMVIAAWCAFTAFMCGITVSVVHWNEASGQERSFRQQAALTLSHLNHRTNSLNDVTLDGLARFMEGKPRISAQDFLEFTRSVVAEPSLIAWIWIPQGDGPTDTLYYLDAQYQSEAFQSRRVRDLGPVAQTITQAARDGLTSQSMPFSWDSGSYTGSDVVALSPIHEAHGSNGAGPVRGYVGFAAKVNALLGEVGRSSALLHHSCELTLFTHDEAGQSSLVASTDSEIAANLSSQAPSMIMIQPILAGNRTYTVTALPSADFYEHNPAWATWLAGFLSIVAFFLILKLIHTLSHSYQNLEALVGIRTSAIRKKEEFLSQLLDNMSSGVVMADKKDLHLALANRRAKELAGEDLQKVLQRDWDAYLAEHPVAVHNDGNFQIVLRYPTDRGCPLLVSVANMSANGKDYYLCSLTDISDLVEAEQALEESNRQLTHAIGEAEKLAREANAASGAKSQFLSLMSHELRTPLNSIMGMTRLIQGSSLTEEQRLFTQTIMGSAQHLLILINEMLDFTKIEAGRIVLAKRRFNPRELIAEEAGALAYFAQQKNLHIQLLPEPKLPELFCGDSARIRQVLAILIENAIKFTTSGSITIGCTAQAPDTENHDADGKAMNLRFWVEDTGIGIDPEKVSSLFEDFTQADGSHTRLHGGLGLGLAISRRLVELMGGAIGADALEPSGSRFWFQLPLCQILSDQDCPPDPASPEVSASRVLVAEADPLGLHILGGILRKLHHPVILCDSLDAIIRDCANGMPDLIVLHPPVLGNNPAEGVALLKKTFPHLPPILGVTSLQPGMDAEYWEELGFAGIIYKPVEPLRLQEAISRCIVGENIAWDRESFEARTMGNASLARELAGDFVEKLPEYMGRLASLVQREDYHTMGAELHGLRGMVQNLDAHRAAEECRSMEQLTRDGDIQGLARGLPGFLSVLAHLKKLILMAYPELGSTDITTKHA